MSSSNARHQISRFASGVAIGLTVTALSIGWAAPAAADPPEVALTELCGVADLSWDSGTLDGASWATVVLRNGAPVAEFSMGSRGGLKLAAADGDRFTVQRAGLPDRTLLYEAPADCVPMPLTVTATAECAGWRLTLANAGSEPITGLRLHSALDGSPAGATLAPVAAGVTDLSFPLPAGSAYAVFSGPLGSDGVLWLSGTYRLPSGCAPSTSTPGTPTASDSTSASAVATSPGVGLPVTGDQTARIGVAGLVLALGGLGLLLVARRRRLAERSERP
jgi:LPXTG-motif cell wall-anchored protein